VLHAPASLGEFKAKATLAYTSLANEADYMTFTPNRIFEFLLKDAEFARSTSERA
jgi:hypothetical protein